MGEICPCLVQAQNLRAVLFSYPSLVGSGPSVVPLLTPTQNPLIRAARVQIGKAPLQDAGAVGRGKGKDVGRCGKSEKCENPNREG